MRLRHISWAVAVCVAMVPVTASAADDKLAKQTVILRVAALDELVANAIFLADLAGQKDRAEEVEKYLKSLAGDDGLKGLNTKKPLGLYIKVGARGFDSEGVLMLPIADEKAFLEVLKKLNFEPEKEKDDDIYKIALPGVPFAGYFRFANGYLYATGVDKSYLDKD